MNKLHTITTEVDHDDDDREFEVAAYEGSPRELRRGDFLALPGNSFIVTGVDSKVKWVTVQGEDDRRKARLPIDCTITFQRRRETDASTRRTLLQRELESLMRGAASAYAHLEEACTKFTPNTSWVHHEVEEYLLAHARWNDCYARVLYLVGHTREDGSKVALLDAIVATTARVREGMLGNPRRLSRSTSVISNVVEDAKFEAQCEFFGNRSYGGGIGHILYLCEDITPRKDDKLAA